MVIALGDGYFHLTILYKPNPVIMVQHPTIQLSRHDLACIDLAIAYIDKHYRDPISIEQLSLEAGMGIKKLRAGLRKRTGLTLADYCFQIRIERSKPLLADTGHPLKAIVGAVGFKTESHFCRKFKELVAMTPIQYRLACAE